MYTRERRAHLFIIPIFSRLDLFRHSYAGMLHTVPGCICLHTNSQLPYAVCDNHLLRPPFEFFLPLSPAEVKIWTETTSAGKWKKLTGELKLHCESAAFMDVLLPLRLHLSNISEVQSLTLSKKLQEMPCFHWQPWLWRKGNHKICTPSVLADARAPAT